MKFLLIAACSSRPRSGRALAALEPAAQQSALQAAPQAELRGWMRSQAVRQDSTQELRASGIEAERVPAESDGEIKRPGEKFSREWVRLVGNKASQIFVPHYAH